MAHIHLIRKSVRRPSGSLPCRTWWLVGRYQNTSSSCSPADSADDHMVRWSLLLITQHTADRSRRDSACRPMPCVNSKGSRSRFTFARLPLPATVAAWSSRVTARARGYEMTESDALLALVSLGRRAQVR